ncbi:MAG: RDD family protein [Bryobacteraceae bacterium]|nr:RDD family protein [Bryobacteraceae bacterium]
MTWYYVSGGQQAGPVDQTTFDDLRRGGIITPETLVWREGLPNWQPYRTFIAEIPHSSSPAYTPVAPGQQRCFYCRQSFSELEVVSLAGGYVCATCKPIVLQRLQEGTLTTLQQQRYAGFWIRFVAYMIDNLLLGIVNSIVSIAALMPFIGAATRGGSPDPFQITGFLIAYVGSILFSLVLYGAYESYFLGKNGATPGKMILGLKVIRPDGRPITWKTGLGRYFAKLLSSLTLSIGYMMAGWDDEKRSLHDRICDTRVVFASK